MGKVLVTGAAGFIGSHLVDFLIQDGVNKKDLRLFVFKNESLININDKDLDIYKGDINNKEDVRKAMEGVDTIYHLAAYATGKDDKKFDVNWIGTRNLLENCKNKKIKKFILFSSIAIYGLPAFTGDKSNISERSPRELVGGYALSKAKAEDELTEFSKKYKLPYSIIRPTTVYGPRDKAGVFQLYKIIKSGLFIKIGKGENKVDYVFVEDLVRGARLVEKKKESGDYILGSSKPIAFNELAETVANSIKVKLPNWYLPKPIALTCGYIIDAVNKLLDIKLPLSSDRVKVMTTNYYFDCSKAKRELGYGPKISFKEGTRITAEWLVKNGLI